MLLFSKMVNGSLAKGKILYENDVFEQDFRFTFVKAVKGCAEKPIVVFAFHICLLSLIVVSIPLYPICQVPFLIVCLQLCFFQTYESRRTFPELDKHQRRSLCLYGASTVHT
jgi:hypothetical protein